MTIDQPLHLCYIIPFAGMLMSIALGPLLAPEFWHRNYLNVSLGWTALVVAMLLSGVGLSTTFFSLDHMLRTEYIPFILMIWALFTITGGIHIVVRTQSSALINTGYLLIGGLIASLIGTTGASMLLIRPFIDMNKHRFYRTHLGVFFIFIVANIGGSLTPLGDPPLFLGFLKGVPFEWPFLNLFKPMMIVLLPLLGLFFILDSYLMKRDSQRSDYQAAVSRKNGESWISVTGKNNILLLLGVVGIVWLSGVWIDCPVIPILNVSFSSFFRNVGLILLGFISLKTTSGTVRNYNHFTWEPFKEVAELFIGIFATLIPVSAMLHQGIDGPFSGLIEMVNPGGIPHNEVYFWLTGILSSVLDNAPTYLVFYNMIEVISGGGVASVIEGYNNTLLAISAGSVFMGAVTYIGNAPNFMVRSIAEKRHVKMPSFFGYIGWSVIILFPLFYIMEKVIF